MWLTKKWNIILKRWGYKILIDYFKFKRINSDKAFKRGRSEQSNPQAWARVIWHKGKINKVKTTFQFWSFIAQTNIVIVEITSRSNN
jgi:hypothetical protein